MSPTGLDPAAEANALANLLYECSAAVDDFRFRAVPPLPPGQRDRLQEESQALDDRAHTFTAEAIGQTLAALAPDLPRIQAVTAEATAQLRVLKDVVRVIAVATSVVSLGTAIAGGDPASILAAVNALAQSING